MNKNTLFKKNARTKNVRIELRRDRGGRYHVVDAKYLDTVNQYLSRWRNLDVRGVTYELREAVTGKGLVVGP